VEWIIREKLGDSMWDEVEHARLGEALAFAAHIHRDQLRKGTDVPYISHLLGVCSLVLEAGGSPEEAIAALLHDAIEDQELSRDDLRERFGPVVEKIVWGCTDTDEQPKPPWRERKQAYLDELPEESTSVLLVSLADKVHNARSLLFDGRSVGAALWSRFNAGREAQIWYYESLAAIYRERMPGALADELTMLVESLKAEVG